DGARLSRRQSGASGTEEWVQGAVDAIVEHPMDSADSERLGESCLTEYLFAERSGGRRSTRARKFSAWLGISGHARSRSAGATRVRRNQRKIQLRCKPA